MNKVCIIGCGMIAQNAHIPAYKSMPEEYEIVAVCDFYEMSAKKVAEEHGIGKFYSDAETMLKEMQPDLVSICTPNMSHKTFVMLALSHGANVLCEKPLAFSTADAHEMFEYAKQQGKVLMTCQSIRFLPERLAAKKLIDEGKVGEVYFAELSRVRRRGIPTWGKFHMKEYSGGGSLIDIGVHGFDSTLWLMGNPMPRSVIATMSKLHANEFGSAKSAGAFKGEVDTSNFNPDEMDVESFAVGKVTFENGAAINFKTCWAANLPETNNIVIAGQGCGIDTEHRKVYAGAEDIYELEVGPSGFAEEPFYGHFCLIQNMAEVLKGNAELFVKPQETINTTAILEAAYISAAEKREVMIEELIVRRDRKMKKTWKVAVIGCGGFSRGQYFPNIRKEANADIVAVVDPIEANAKKACEDFNIPEYYSNVDDLIANCDFDIAIDAAVIQEHHNINMKVLSAGKHLISQKTAAPTVEMMTEQIEMAKKMNVKFVCVPVHPMRYDINTAKQWIKDGVIGDAYYIKCNSSHGGPEYFQYRNVDPTWFFEDGAGALIDMGVHGLQIVTTIFGPAKRVACMAKVTCPTRKVRSGSYDGTIIKTDKIPDQYVITLDFGDNKLALVDTGFSQKATKAPLMEIFGDKGTITFTEPYMNNPIPEVYMDDHEKGIRGWMQPRRGTKPPKKINSQCCCLADMVDAIENDREPVLSAEHARHVLEIMCKIPEAIESGRTIDLETTF